MYQNDKHKTNSQQHKDRESCLRKSNRIPRDFFKMHKNKNKKNEEQTNRSIRSSSENPIQKMTSYCQYQHH